MSRLLVNHASFVRAIPAGCWIKPLTCLPGPVGEFVAGSQGARVLRALDPLADGQQRGELVAGPRPHPPPARSSGQGGRGWTGCAGARRPGPARGWAAARRTGRGPGRIPRLPGPAGEVGADDQGVGMLGALDPLADRQQRGKLVAGPGRIPRLSSFPRRCRGGRRFRAGSAPGRAGGGRAWRRR